MRRVVVDPNVLLSALVGNPEAAPAILLEAIHDHVVEMVACPALIVEVRENLTEPYFRAMRDNHAHVNFPASSPFVLSVGGTKLEGEREVTWWEAPDYRTEQGGERQGAV